VKPSPEPVPWWKRRGWGDVNRVPHDRRGHRRRLHVPVDAHRQGASGGERAALTQTQRAEERRGASAPESPFSRRVLGVIGERCVAIDDGEVTDLLVSEMRSEFPGLVNIPRLDAVTRFVLAVIDEFFDSIEERRSLRAAMADVVHVGMTTAQLGAAASIAVRIIWTAVSETWPNGVDAPERQFAFDALVAYGADVGDMIYGEADRAHSSGSIERVEC